ncbi:MAG TPA: hypothetical protein VEB42_02545, partial [Chitinophagaceae bacterium]|nr:hypothetical protein [Chitinophagaceae bacterium]
MSRLESLQSDPALMQELMSRVSNGHELPKATRIGAKNIDVKRFVEGTFFESAGSVPFSNLEAVILDFLRPCLVIRNNTYEIPASDVWKNRLEPFRKLLERRIPSVGRIEFKSHPRFKWGGTGWLIAENTIVTNRHVAVEFAR